MSIGRAERLGFLAVCAASYGTGVGGLALAVGSPIGWAILAVGGGLPAALLAARELNEAAIRQEQVKHAPERRATIPPRAGAGPAPEPLRMPPSL